MKRRLGLLLLLAGSYVAARVLVAQALHGRPPELRPFALHVVAVPLAQLAVLEGAARLAARRRAPA